MPAPNLTALLALSALADLIFFRILGPVFLPSQDGTAVERWAAGFALFVSNFSGILGLVLGVVALLYALRSDEVFPRSMRITVSTVGLFFSVLAGLGVLWILAPGYHVHMRISHGFLVFFLALGIWRGTRPWRSKLALSLFAIPIVVQAAALFVHRVGWSHVDPGQMLRLAHAITLIAMTSAPILVVPGHGVGAGSPSPLALERFWPPHSVQRSCCASTWFKRRRTTDCGSISPV